MADFSSWSLNLGRWWGVRVRLHAFFLLFGVFTLYLSIHGPDAAMLGIGLASLGILFVSVLVHELGHCYAAYRVGGVADQIIVGPWGGLAQPHVPHEPILELITAISGPLANMLVCLAVVPLLYFCAGQDPLALLLNPLAPVGVADGSAWWIVGLKLTLWINWLLAIVNLLPAFPFDGGRVLRALFWKAFDYRTAVLIVSCYARCVAVGLAVIAFWKYKEVLAPAPQSLLPAGIPLLLLAIFLFFSAQQEADRLEQSESEDGLEGYDFSQGYTSLERTFDAPHRGPGLVRRWLEQRKQARTAKQRQIERDEEAQFDTILARIHDTGMDGLTSKERALLDRVSARYRNRQQS